MLKEKLPKIGIVVGIIVVVAAILYVKFYILDATDVYISEYYEGIKYELSKLWMMSCLIEEKLHSEKFQKLPSFAIESSSAHKANLLHYQHGMRKCSRRRDTRSNR